jgi:hypothetical protein
MVRRLITVAVIAALITLVVAGLPDIKRYIEMREM